MSKASGWMLWISDWISSSFNLGLKNSFSFSILVLYLAIYSYGGLLNEKWIRNIFKQFLELKEEIQTVNDNIQQEFCEQVDENLKYCIIRGKRKQQPYAYVFLVLR